MKKQIGFFILAAAMAASAYAQSNNTTVLPLRELTTTIQGGPMLLSVNGLPAVETPSYWVVGPSPASQTDFFLTAAQGDPFVVPNPSSGLTSIPVNYDNSGHPSAAYIVAELRPGDAPVGSTLYVGRPSDVAGPIVTRSGLLCTAQVGADQMARCLIDLSIVPPPNPNQLVDFYTVYYWALVQAPSGATSQKFPLRLYSAAIFSVKGIATGPGHIDAGVTAPLRIDSPALSRTTWSEVDSGRYYGVLGIGSSSSAAPAQAILPFAVTRQNPISDYPLSLTPDTYSLYGIEDASVQGNYPDQTGVFGLESGQTLRQLYFDFPPTTDGSAYDRVDVSIYSFTPGISLQAYAIRTDFPLQSSAATIAPAPPADGTAVQAVYENGSQVMTFAPTPGRWYVVVTNNGSSSTVVDAYMGAANLRKRYGAGANPTIHPGVYYNAQRSGHGVTISQAAGQQMLYWYTYLEDGTPTWYVAQAAAPNANSGWWQAPLFRASWNGSKARLTQVGSVNVTPIAQNRFTFNWNLEDQYGSEVMGQIARFGDCPALNGATTNLNGAWYAPAMSGYGVDVLALPEQQFNIFYFYDSLGLARWGVGGTGSFAQNSTQEFSQVSGFCPSCTYVKTQSQSLGTANVSYTSDSSGHLSTNFVLKAPLSGTWNTDQTMQRLTGSSTCAQ